MGAHIKPVPSTKLCRACNQVKDTVSSFHFRRRPSGQMKPQSLCKPCFQAYKRKRYPRTGSQTSAKKNRKLRMKIAGAVTPELWAQVFALHGNYCLCCGTNQNVSLDHVIPISKGGMTTLLNLQPLCSPCNGRKGVQLTDYRRSSG